MKFREDLIVDFLKSKNKFIESIDTYKTQFNTIVTEVMAASSEAFTFIDFNEVCISGIDARGGRYFRPAQSKKIKREWQSFVVENTDGHQRETLLNCFIKDARGEFESKIEDLCVCDINAKHTLKCGDDEFKHVLKLEETRFKLSLEACKEISDYAAVRARILNSRAYYGRQCNSCMQYILDHAKKSIDMEGQLVYGLNQHERQNYEKIKNTALTIDSIMKYQMYRTDQLEDQNCK